MDTCSDLESGNAGDGAAQDESMNVMRTFIGIDGLEVCRVAHHMKFGADAITSMHVPRHARDLERPSAIIPFDEADRLRENQALIKVAAHTNGCVKSQNAR